jgi:hypothetical protein
LVDGVPTALGVNSNLGARVATGLFLQRKSHTTDHRNLADWTTLLTKRLKTLQNN